jgi:hypothetical protein
VTAPWGGSLAELLPGTWRVGATNFPLWLKGDKVSPTFTYELRRQNPLELTDRVSYFTSSGEEKSIVGVDRLRGDEFTWRGKGPLSLFTSRWSVIGAASDGAFVVIRFSKTFATPAGVDIVSREGLDADDLRTMVAQGPEGFGLTHEEFASLTWLETTLPS